ncbi:hypothetical protein [Ruficoccus sp. ZRK36]|uniref:hypothetical protein n=1 Tax=Ruficoccus sp. ZRK36 TaxID=2866311 RepID=UPI001C730DC3|nr:hypothetical protein [Ruficoccus sp. ZRK36]QYY35180.1 hypothetical protein K0V07_12845 [Ruficoccus sp. ZRK36]
MLKFKRPVQVFILFTLAAASAATARIGETQSELEGRMLKNRTAVKVPARNQEVMLADRSIPYKHIYALLPEGVEQVIYFKPAEAEAAATSDLETPGRNPFPDGWTVHVIYYNGRSVFEAYRRAGAPMSRYEMESILVLNKGDSNWERVDAKNAAPSVIGYNFQRADKQVLANKKGGTLILFSPQLDAVMLETRQVANAESDQEAQEKAPDSVRGF